MDSGLCVYHLVVQTNFIIAFLGHIYAAKRNVQSSRKDYYYWLFRTIPPCTIYSYYIGLLDQLDYIYKIAIQKKTFDNTESND